jgi:hypothetical protein
MPPLKLVQQELSKQQQACANRSYQQNMSGRPPWRWAYHLHAIGDYGKRIDSVSKFRKRGRHASEPQTTASLQPCAVKWKVFGSNSLELQTSILKDQIVSPGSEPCGSQDSLYFNGPPAVRPAGELARCDRQRRNLCIGPEHFDLGVLQATTKSF